MGRHDAAVENGYPVGEVPLVTFDDAPGPIVEKSIFNGIDRLRNPRRASRFFIAKNAYSKLGIAVQKPNSGESACLPHERRERSLANSVRNPTG